jgi:MFS family permease
VIVLGGAALHESAVRAARRLDVPGALAVTAALATLVYGVVETTHHPWGSVRTLVVLAIAAALFALTAAIEARSPNPLIPFAVLRRGPVATSTVLMLIHGATVTSSLYFQSLYLQLVRGYSPLDAGLLMMPFSLLLILTPALSSRVTTRYGPRMVAMGSLLVETVGLLWLSRWTVHGSIVLDMVAPGIVFGVGGSVCFFAISVLMTSSVERERSGLASGLFNSGRQVGGSIGLAALTVVATAHTRSLEAGHSATLAIATAEGYGRALLVTAGLIMIGFVLIAAQRWPHTRAPLATVRGRAQPSEGSPR